MKEKEFEDLYDVLYSIDKGIKSIIGFQATFFIIIISTMLFIIIRSC